MKLRNKTLFVICITFIGLMTVLLIISAKIILSGFSELEEKGIISSTEIYNQSQMILKYLIITIIVVNLAFGLLIFLLLDRIIISRLVKLGSDMSNINLSENFSEHIKISGKDEITDVAELINNLLKTSEHYYNNLEDDKQRQPDITELELTRQSLIKIEERYRNLFQNAPIGIYRTAPDGKILMANPTLIKLLGYSSFSELASRNLEKEGFETDYPRVEFKTRIDRDGEVKGLEAVWKRRDGSLIYVRENAKAIKDENGNLLYYEGTIEDITERKRAEEELQNSFEILTKTIKGTIQALSTTAEMRDPYTAGHHRRVSELACAIGREMDLDENTIEGLRISGSIHDIGKICVPAEILSKPGKLTEFEFNIIKTHPQVGYDILKSIEFPWPIAQIVAQHHERINGTGYPLGLRGGDILLEARILAVSDVVEAMVSHRPYRPAIGLEKALEEIRNNKGILYDNEVVNACLKIFSKANYNIEFLLNT